MKLLKLLQVMAWLIIAVALVWFALAIEIKAIDIVEALNILTIGIVFLLVIKFLRWWRT